MIEITTKSSINVNPDRGEQDSLFEICLRMAKHPPG
jgi:hypothetical protein